MIDNEPVPNALIAAKKAIADLEKPSQWTYYKIESTTDSQFDAFKPPLRNFSITAKFSFPSNCFLQAQASKLELAAFALPWTP